MPKPRHVERGTELRLIVADQANKFRQHAQATGRLMADWDAAFTMWLDKATDFQPRALANGNGQGVRAGDLLDRQMQRIAKLEAAERSERSLP